MPFRVLVVDDAEANRVLLAEALLLEQYDVAAVDCGHAALRSIAAAPPDLVLLDVMMPDMNGLEVCASIRAQPEARDIAIVLVTALADRESRGKGFEAGADDYLTKPIDISELRMRVRTMARLRRYRNLVEERGRAAAIANLSPAAIVMNDAGGLIVEANAAARALLSQGGDLTGSLLTQTIAPVDAADRDWLIAGQPTPAGVPRVVAIMVDGQQHAVEISRVVASYQDQDVAIVVLQDVTELDRLRDVAQRLRRHEAVARAATGVAHDFRNYLTAIQMGLDLLGYELPSHVTAGRETIRDIQAQIDIGVDLTRRITAIGRGSEEPSEAIDMAKILCELTPLMRHWAGDAELLLELLASPPIRANRDDVFQVISNLVVNAAQAVGGQGRIVVRVGPDRENGTTGPTRLEVADNGCGMDDATLDRIFEAYFTTKESRGGTGLGLATVHEIVTRVGGLIRVDSAIGRGTTFSIVWPAFTD